METKKIINFFFFFFFFNRKESVIETKKKEGLGKETLFVHDMCYKKIRKIRANDVQWTVSYGGQ